MAGLLVMTGTLSRTSHLAQLALAGTLAAICGAWFIVGPLACLCFRARTFSSRDRHFNSSSIGSATRSARAAFCLLSARSC